VDPEESQDDDVPSFRWLPPEDRLWRHPSEVGGHGDRAGSAGRRGTVRSSSRTGRRSWALALSAGTLGAVLALGVSTATGLVGGRTVIETVHIPTPNTTAVVTDDSAMSVGNWAAIANALAPSVVGIRVPTPSGTAESSGVVYATGDHDSYVITAADVVSGAPITVVFSNGFSEMARLVGLDPTSGIALLATAGVHGAVPPVGSVSDVQVADPVLAVGARNDGATPVAIGSISGVDQVLAASGGDTFYGMLSVSGVDLPAADDGGALVDAQGEVVGIATDLTPAAPTAGTGYAVPIDTAERVADELLAGTAPSHPWIGVDDATDLPSATAQALGVSGGAEVGEVAPGSPAAAAGLRAGDVITRFGGQPVSSSGALVMLLAHAQTDRRVELSYVAAGRTRTVAVTVGTVPPSGG
jgi:putative serine protease PepD